MLWVSGSWICCNRLCVLPEGQFPYRYTRFPSIRLRSILTRRAVASTSGVTCARGSALAPLPRSRSGQQKKCKFEFLPCVSEQGSARIRPLGQRLCRSPPAGGEASVVGEERSSPSFFQGTCGCLARVLKRSVYLLTNREALILMQSHLSTTLSVWSSTTSLFQSTRQSLDWTRG